MNEWLPDSCTRIVYEDAGEWFHTLRQQGRGNRVTAYDNAQERVIGFIIESEGAATVHLLPMRRWAAAKDSGQWVRVKSPYGPFWPLTWVLNEPWASLPRKFRSLLRGPLGRQKLAEGFSTGIEDYLASEETPFVADLMVAGLSGAFAR